MIVAGSRSRHSSSKDRSHFSFHLTCFTFRLQTQTEKPLEESCESGPRGGTQAQDAYASISCYLIFLSLPSPFPLPLPLPLPPFPLPLLSLSLLFPPLPSYMILAHKKQQLFFSLYFLFCLFFLLPSWCTTLSLSLDEAEREANKYEYTVFVAQIHPKVLSSRFFSLALSETCLCMCNCMCRSPQQAAIGERKGFVRVFFACRTG